MIKSILTAVLLHAGKKAWKHAASKPAAKTELITKPNRRARRFNVGRLQEDVSAMLYKHDIYGLACSGAPIDEYDLEATMILGDLRLICNSEGQDQIDDANHLITMSLVDALEAAFDLDVENEKIYEKWYDKMMPVAEDLVKMMLRNDYVEVVK